MNHFKGKQFKKDVIIVAVGYYLRYNLSYNLSYREVQELLYDRGINVCHTKIGSVAKFENQTSPL